MKIPFVWLVSLTNIYITPLCFAQVVTVINMIPLGYGAEEQQNSEPWLSVSSINTNLVVATAFGDADGPTKSGPRSPLYISTNGGITWNLKFIVPVERDTDPNATQPQKANVSDMTVSIGNLEHIYAGLLLDGALPGSQLGTGLLRGDNIVAPLPGVDDLKQVYLAGR